MSTTTQILFNSPALHSLKRDQLVKLCKIHSLKANGKNKDLIERLQFHAKTLPPDDPLSIATRSDNPPTTDTQLCHIAMPRPSEQWEVVMDSIAEVDEDTKSTLRSNRGASNAHASEFGTNVSQATSLGLKRNASKTDATVSSSSSSLSSKDTSDANVGPEEPPVEPIPGQMNLQGFPAPANARLSLSQAPTTTTIRLISTSSCTPGPFATSFDLVPGTPGRAGEDGAGSVTYLGSHPDDGSDMEMDIDMPGGLGAESIYEPTPKKVNTSVRLNTGATPKSVEKPSAEPIDIFSPAPKPQNASSRSRVTVSTSEPFVFGSPLPQHNMSNFQFRKTAQSVLDEMNKRLAEEGVEGINMDVLNNRQKTDETETQEKVSLRVGSVFDKIHQQEFDKMDSIATHYAARRGAQSSTAQSVLLVVKERQSGVPAARHRPNGARVASAASSKKMLPGGFGDEEDEDEVADRRMSKRPRVEREEPSTSDAPLQAKRVSIAPPPSDPEEEARKQKEREAIRRRLDHNKAKRRSSMGRPSLGRAPPPQKTKPSRFGFLSSAKSLVQNVWNRGAGSKAPSTNPGDKGGCQANRNQEDGCYSRFFWGASSQLPGKTNETRPLRRKCIRRPITASGRSTLAPPAISTETSGTVTSTRSSSSSTTTGSRLSTVAGHSRNHSRTGSILVSRPWLSSQNQQPHPNYRHITNSPRSPARSPRTKIFSQPLTSPPAGPPMSLTAAAMTIVSHTANEASSSSKPPIPPEAEGLPGRRPRISRSKVIARLASVRAAGTSGQTEKANGKTRSSVGAGVAGKTRQSHGGGRGGDVLMSAKKRARQSEYARRRSRAVAGDSSTMALD
ncbi:hypothetical protein BU15DRAFT_88519 [Melanogaster broomeanus]|nr:hypothetical protein BU15DRAFT_88519 [Melanogaster broomeanus]